jgi:hypothetical protein
VTALKVIEVRDIIGRRATARWHLPGDGDLIILTAGQDEIGFERAEWDAIVAAYQHAVNARVLDEAHRKAATEDQS